MELNVGIAIPQVVDNKQVYVKIPHVLVPKKIPSSHLPSSDDVIDTPFKWKPPIPFPDSDSPPNCLNDSTKILLSTQGNPREKK
jgi:hypothetical protein